MSNTKSHALKKLHQSRVPEDWIVITTDGETASSRYVRYRDCRIVKHVDSGLTTVGSMSIWHKDVTRGRGFVVCVAWDMYYLLCKSGLWHRVESGQWSIADDCGDVVSGIPVGMQVTSDPPTIMDIIDEHGTFMRCIDFRNFGVSRKLWRDENVPGEKISDADLLDVILEYNDHVKMGPQRWTAAGQGMACFRRHHYNGELVPTVNMHIRGLERESYYGGRCEAYRLGKLHGRCVYLDFMSMYGRICANERLPIALVPDDREEKDRPTDDEIYGVSCISECMIYTDTPCVPIRISGRTVWPVGEFVTTLCWPEIKMAMNAGAYVEPLIDAWYIMGTPLKKYADWYLSHRGKSAGAYSSVVESYLKSCFNASLGKFASKEKKWTRAESDGKRCEWGQWYAPRPDGRCMTQWRSIQGRYSYLDDDVEPADGCPFLSSWITSIGRCLLAELISVIGHENVYYCDTDGIICNADAAETVRRWYRFNADGPYPVTSRWISDDVEIFGTKHYRYGKELVCAGLVSDRVAERDGKTMVVEPWPFEQSLWHREPFSPKLVSRQLRRHALYMQGHAAADGTVYPWRVDRIEVTSQGENVDGERRFENTIVGSLRPDARGIGGDGAGETADP